MSTEASAAQQGRLAEANPPPLLSASLLQSILDRSPLGVALVTGTGELRWSNPSLAVLLGHAESDLAGQMLHAHVDPADRDDIIDTIGDVVTGRLASATKEVRLVARDRREVWVELHIQSVPAGAVEPALAAIQAVDISQRRLPRNRFQVMFDHAADAMFLSTAEGVYIGANSAALHMLGMTREELLGKSMLDIVDPDELPTNPIRLDTLRSGVRVITIRRLRRKDGSVFSAEIAGQQQTDGTLLGQVRDVTERTHASEQLHRTLSRLSLAQDVAGIGVWELDIDTGDVNWDPQMFSLFGANRDHPGGAKAIWQEAVHPEDVARHEREVRECVDRFEEMHTELRVIGADGRVRHLESHARAVYKTDGMGARLIGLNLDVTERRREAEELRGHRDHLDDLVRQRTADLDRSNRELEQFALIASHDLQEPLRKIQAFGKILRKEYTSALDAEGQDYLSRMTATAARMQQLIESLLALSRVTTGGKAFGLVECGEIAEQVRADLSLTAAESGAQIEIGELPAVWGDGAQIRQLLQNLVSNSLKFLAEGRRPVVRIRGGVASGHPWLTVEDNGIGVEPEFRERIFGMFQRLHGTRPYEGSGIGLAICSKIVERHGGSIRAEGAEPSGTRMVIELPLLRPGASAPGR